MNRLRLYLLALAALFVCSVKADEGMWLLQLMQQQHSIDMMKKQGLKLEAQDLYNPNGISLKDAVGIFGGGCTGEIISPEGLILTNHHCGYASIQQHSSVEHDYLTDGFWATSRDKELPTPGLNLSNVSKILRILSMPRSRRKKSPNPNHSAIYSFKSWLMIFILKVTWQTKRELFRKLFRSMPEINSIFSTRKYIRMYVW